MVIEIYIPASGSLKTKRYYLNRIKEKLKNKFNISVAETGYTDKWQRSELGIACVSTSDKVITGTFTKIINVLEKSKDGYEVLRDEYEII